MKNIVLIMYLNFGNFANKNLKQNRLKKTQIGWDVYNNRNLPW